MKKCSGLFSARTIGDKIGLTPFTFAPHVSGRIGAAHYRAPCIGDYRSIANRDSTDGEVVADVAAGLEFDRDEFAAAFEDENPPCHR